MTKIINEWTSDKSSKEELRLLEQKESKKNLLVKELKKGEQSGFSKEFNKDSFLKDVHGKYSTNY
jgi:antitoxin ParD1/3/4